MTIFFWTLRRDSLYLSHCKHLFTCLLIVWMRDSFPCLFICASLDGNRDNWGIIRKVKGKRMGRCLRSKKECREGSGKEREGREALKCFKYSPTSKYFILLYKIFFFFFLLLKPKAKGISCIYRWGIMKNIKKKLISGSKVEKIPRRNNTKAVKIIYFQVYVSSHTCISPSSTYESN